MKFSVVAWKDTRGRTSRNRAYLERDGWNDFGYVTQFDLVVFDKGSVRHEIGPVKIGQFGMSPEQKSPNVPDAFEELNQNFFSVGQSETYYEQLISLGSEVRETVLKSLRDLAFDPTHLERALGEKVMKTSLLRDVGLRSIRGRFKRLARGDTRLLSYQFTYRFPRQPSQLIDDPELSFEVMPNSMPPTNIHVLIGRNGVGKTRLLTNMTRSLTERNQALTNLGSFEAEDTNGDESFFANLVSVSFSAFDTFDALPVPSSEVLGMKYSYIGLRKLNDMNDAWEASPKTVSDLTDEFLKSIRLCRKTGKTERWQEVLKILETDPMFAEAEIRTEIEGEDTEVWQRRIESLFRRLSSGHKIVLLTITRLVELVVERTLVILDEPEAHLHPPLLSAFTRTLSHLLKQQNGVAIIATHSPVVLQEVPKLCVWKLQRSGSLSKVERPEIETFGENVGVLTREIFGLEVVHSGFHQLIETVVDREEDYAAVLRAFHEQLGAEARALVHVLLATKAQEEQDQ